MLGEKKCISSSSSEGQVPGTGVVIDQRALPASDTQLVQMPPLLGVYTLWQMQYFGVGQGPVIHFKLGTLIWFCTIIAHAACLHENSALPHDGVLHSRGAFFHYPLWYLL